MNKPTRTRRLLDRAVPGGLDEYVRNRRNAGQSWETIAGDVRNTTREDITANTLRRWYEKGHTSAA